MSKSVHVFMTSPFAVEPVSVGVFPHFDSFRALRFNSDFHKVLEFVKEYLLQLNF